MLCACLHRASRLIKFPNMWCSTFCVFFVALHRFPSAKVFLRLYITFKQQTLRIYYKLYLFINEMIHNIKRIQKLDERTITNMNSIENLQDPYRLPTDTVTVSSPILQKNSKKLSRSYPYTWSMSWKNNANYRGTI